METTMALDFTPPPQIPAAEPTPNFLSDARMVAANPEQYANRPLLRALAWNILMGTSRSLTQSALAQMPVEFSELSSGAA
jgi:hypothetical protein